MRKRVPPLEPEEMAAVVRLKGSGPPRNCETMPSEREGSLLRNGATYSSIDTPSVSRCDDADRELMSRGAERCKRTVCRLKPRAVVKSSQETQIIEQFSA